VTAAAGLRGRAGEGRGAARAAPSIHGRIDPPPEDWQPGSASPRPDTSPLLALRSLQLTAGVGPTAPCAAPCAGSSGVRPDESATLIGPECCVTGSERGLELDRGRGGVGPGVAHTRSVASCATGAGHRCRGRDGPGHAYGTIPGWHPARRTVATPRSRHPPAHGCAAATSTTRSGDPRGRSASA